MKTTLIPSIQHMYSLNFFIVLLLMDYIQDIVIPDSNKSLNSLMNLREYFIVIGCRLIMACYVGHYVRDLFLKEPITPQKGTPIRLNHIIYGRCLDRITQVMYYTNTAINEFNDNFFQQMQIKEGWKKNKAAHFNSSWVSVLDE